MSRGVTQEILFAVDHAWRAFMDDCFRERVLNEVLYTAFKASLVELEHGVQDQRAFEHGNDVNTLRQKVKDLEQEKADLELEIVSLLNHPGDA